MTVALAPPSETRSLEDMPGELLEQEITELAAHINAATCRWLELVAELDRRRIWADWGCRTCAHWLSVQCGIAIRTGREQVRVCRALAGLPKVREHFARGELSYSQVRAISRVATADTEETLLMYARHATGAQLATLCRAYRGVVSRELGATNAAYRERYLDCWHDDDGSLVINARIPAEEGALVVQALEAAREQLRGDRSEAAERDRSEGGPAEPSPAEGTNDADGYSGRRGLPAVGRADALVLMAETVLESGCSRVGPGRRDLVVHVDAAGLAHDDEQGCCHAEDGPALHPETARRLGCDASVTRVLERDGKPLSVGRKTRTVPPPLARALRNRDGGCRFPGCSERRFVDAHHIEHWAHGGRTDLANLVQLCRHHHRLVHEGGYGLAKEASGVVFRRPDGRRIPAAPRPRRGDRHGLVRSQRDLGIDAQTCVPQWYGDRLNLADSVEGLVWLDSRFENWIPPINRRPPDQDEPAT